jgi:hypothetical protein
MRKRITLLVTAVVVALTMSLGGVAFAKITTENPGGQPGGCQHNPNCQNVNPTGKAPPGQNK